MFRSWKVGSLGSLSVACVILAVAGCGRSDGLLTISGTATLDGNPIQDGSVSLMPVDGKGIAGGGTITNGRYTAESSPGQMAVQIYAHEKFEKPNPTREEVERGLHIDTRQLLPAVYNQQSKLRINVSADNRTHNFELTSDGAIPAGMGSAAP